MGQHGQSLYIEVPSILELTTMVIDYEKAGSVIANYLITEQGFLYPRNLTTRQPDLDLTSRLALQLNLAGKEDLNTLNLVLLEGSVNLALDEHYFTTEPAAHRLKYEIESAKRLRSSGDPSSNSLA